jgi:inhibitor of KinA sporulation pathway (predicted exonuclease)
MFLVCLKREKMKMGKNWMLDKIIVVDLEATCWDRGEEQPRGQLNDIIEIGVCTLDLKTFTIEKIQGIIVKPTTSKVSEFCTKLTTLTQDVVDHGHTFKGACDKLYREYNEPTRTWASWGDYDRTQLEKQCKREGVSFPLSIRHINIKNLYSVLNGLPKELGLGTAVERCSLSFDGTPHRGMDDAKNIAAILRILVKKFRGI